MSDLPPLRRPLPKTELHTPVPPARTLPPMEEPRHIPVVASNYLPSTSDLTAIEFEQMQSRLASLAMLDEIFSTWAAIPIACWGGMTLAGCIYNFHFTAAVFVGLLTVAGCFFPFVHKGQFRPFGVWIGILFSIFGWVLLDRVGEILMFGTRRVIAWLSAARRDELTHSVVLDPDDVPLSFDNILSASVVGLLALLSFFALGQAIRYFIHEREKSKLREKIELYAERQRREFAKTQTV